MTQIDILWVMKFSQHLKMGHHILLNIMNEARKLFRLWGILYNYYLGMHRLGPHYLFEVLHFLTLSLV